MIEVFALDRTGLFDERRDRWRKVEVQINRVMKESPRLKSQDEPEGRNNLALEIEEFSLFAREDQEYTGLARQIIERTVEDFYHFAQTHLPRNF